MAQPLGDKIKHVVVLMMENRSFDNVLGGLYPRETIEGHYRGVRKGMSNPLDPKHPHQYCIGNDLRIQLRRSFFNGPGLERIFPVLCRRADR